jgi:rod shape-determining protein MreB
MVVDIGGGTTDIAVLSLGGIVYSRSLRVGGDKFDAAIVQYIRRQYNLLVGEQTAEEVKIRVGTVYPGGREATASIRGRDLVTGLPKTVEITSAELREAMREPTEAVVSAIKEVLERTPPELAADIVDRGIVMTGGGSLLHGLDLLVQEETGLPVHLAEDPVSSVALGTGKALTMLDSLRANGAVTRCG